MLNISNKLEHATIGLDFKTFSLQSSGIGRYTIHLISELLKRSKFKYIAFPSPQTDFSLLPKVKDNSFLIQKGIHDSIQSSLIRQKILLPYQIKKTKINLFHTFDYGTNLNLFSKKNKNITTIHDMIAFKYPEFFVRKHQIITKHMTTHSVKNADHIIAVSHSTKQDILEYFPKLNSQKISVVYPGSSLIPDYSLNNEEIDQFIAKYQLSERYFLCLGTIEPRKNLTRLIQAFRKFRKQSSFEHFRLVIVGKKGWLQGDIEKNVQDLKKENIVTTGFIPDAYLKILYSNAVGFIYPSLYEGFGLPVIEAMSFQTPVITSHVSSLPEISGNAALLIDPLSVTNIQKAMMELAENEGKRKHLIEEGIKQIKKFSWETAAIKTENIYKKVL